MWNGLISQNPWSSPRKSEPLFLTSCIPPDCTAAILSPIQSDRLHNPQNQTKGCILFKSIFDCGLFVCLFVFLWKSEMCLFKKKEATKKKPSTLQVTFCFHSFTLIKLSAITRLWMKNQSWKWWDVTLIHSWQRTAGQRGCNNSSEDAHPEEALLTIHSAVLHSGNLHLGSNGKELLQPLSDPMAQTHFH